MAKKYCKLIYFVVVAGMFSSSQLARAQNNPNLGPLIDPSTLTQSLTQSAQQVAGTLPPTDAAGITAASARIQAVATQAEALRIQSESTRTGQVVEVMQTPAELNGLVTRIPSTPLAPGTYKAEERSFEEGSNAFDIEMQMIWDYLLNNLDFWLHSGWQPSGICKKRGTFWPVFAIKEKYYWPALWFEQSSDMYRGRYLQNGYILEPLPIPPHMATRDLFKDLIEDGEVLGVETGFATLRGHFEDRYEMTKDLTPNEINRVKAIAMPKNDEEGRQRTFRERTNKLRAALSSTGDIPSVPGNTYDQGKQILKSNNQYGESGALGRNVETHRFPGLIQLRGLIGAPVARYHHKFFHVSRDFHRTDNPLIFPLTRNQNLLDLLLISNRQVEEFNLGALPGHCLQYDQMQGHGLPGAMGLFPNGDFGLLSKVHRDAPSRSQVSQNAIKRRCLKGGGSVYPLTNFVAGGKNFESAFYTKFLRMNKLSELYSIATPHMALPMFHQYKDYGSRFASKIQIVRASFGEKDKPHHINEETLNDTFQSPWTQRDYENRRRATDSDGGIITGRNKGRDLDIGSGVEWHRYDLCPPGFKVILGNKKQIRGNEKYTG